MKRHYPEQLEDIKNKFQNRDLSNQKLIQK
jgi:hypothetical protein